MDRTAVALALVTALSVGCSSSSDGTPSGSSGSSGKTTSSSVSLAFTSKCARCHGATGTGQGIYPGLPGTLTEAEFVATVRAGRKDMPSFDTSQISDADLAADYDWMKTKR